MIDWSHVLHGQIAFGLMIGLDPLAASFKSAKSARLPARALHKLCSLVKVQGSAAHKPHTPLCLPVKLPGLSITHISVLAMRFVGEKYRVLILEAIFQGPTT